MAGIENYKWEQKKSKSKQFGEVFTPDNIVQDMLDLADTKLYKTYKKSGKAKNYDDNMKIAMAYIRKKILEPSCGDGQILIRLLYRKMQAIKKCDNAFDSTPLDRQRMLLIALTNIYGIDVQPDVIDIAKERLLEMATGKQVTTFDVKSSNITIPAINLNIDYSDDLINDIKAIIDNNIICGNTLTGHRYKVVGDKAEPTDKYEDADTNWKLLLTEYAFGANGVQYQCSMQDFWIHPIKNGESTTYVIDDKPTYVYELVDIGHIKDRQINIGEMSEVQKAIIESERKAQEDIENGVW